MTSGTGASGAGLTRTWILTSSIDPPGRRGNSTFAFTRVSEEADWKRVEVSAKRSPTNVHVQPKSWMSGQEGT